MTASTSESKQQASVPAASAPGLPAWPLVAIGLLTLVAAWLSFAGGWPAVAGVVTLASTAAALQRVRPGHDATGHAASKTASESASSLSSANAVASAAPSKPQSSSAAPGKRAESGHGIMISEVLPVWERQLEMTRGTSDAGLAQVLQSFTAMNEALDELMNNLHGLGGASAPGAVDDAVAQSSSALQAMSRPALLACEMREKVLHELNQCAMEANEFDQLSRQILELGRHTRLLAFNASIEANRGGKGESGSGAVATEMRMLATRMSESGLALQRLIATQRQRLNLTVSQSVTEQTTPEELRMEVDLRAREALQLLMTHVGASLSSSSSLREASTAMRDNLEAAMINFQFGDRVSQMLSILGGDINKFVEWTAHHPLATRDDAAEWLKRLEASYTMDEQRSEHHGNAHVDRGSEIEFF